ncbi:MAG: hypothetical protein EDX89_18495 [Acidobacteria bacterium]|nr:MAG: hypothetical protein EDX89_18495 [Acidobacteriota bacterium]MCE7956818.1 hypothetical protein [Acidobacteria bacterium ACB2]
MIGPGATRPAVRPSNGRIALLLFLVSWVGFNANLRTTAGYDGLAASLIPFGLWHGDGLYLDAVGGTLPPEVGYSIVRSRTGHWVSLYPVVTPLLVSPLYLPTLFLEGFRPDDPVTGRVVRSLMEKLSASTLAALSVAVVFLLLRRRASPRLATFLALAYAFGTSTWSVSSQQLQQHAAAQLLLALCLLLVTGEGQLRLAGLGFLGLLSGLLTANRPQDVFFSAALAWIVLRRHGRRSWPFLLGAGLVAAALVAYNVTHFSGVTGGYGDYRLPDGGRLEPSFPSLTAVAGLLFSNRGVFTFSPILLLLLLRPRAIAGPVRENAILAGGWVSCVLFFAAYPGWSGGYTYGPRYLADGLPLLFLFLAGPAASVRSVAGRTLLGVSVLFAVSLQAIGAFCYPGGDSGNERHGSWTVSRSSPVLAFSAGLQPLHFLPLVAPSLPMARALAPEEGRGALRFAEPPPASVPADARPDVRVAVTNRGKGRWSSFGGWFGEGAVKLAAWWTTGDGSPTPGSVPTEAWIASSLLPGETAVTTIRPRAPAAAGSYRLRLGIVQVGNPSAGGPGAEGPGVLEAPIQVSPAALGSGPRVIWGGVDGPSEIVAGRRARYRVRLRNGSTTPWTDQVHLSYHWRSADGVELHREGGRANLVPMSEEGGFGLYLIEVVADVPAGTYRLELDLVEEGVAWFAARGGAPLALDVAVREAGPSVTFAPLPPGAFRAELEAPDVPASMRPGLTIETPVRVRNLSPVPFPADGRIDGGLRVNVTYRWLDAGGSVVVPDGARTALPSPLAPGEAVTVPALLVAPETPGEYELEIDLVQEGVEWFGIRGSRTLRRRVAVD